ncbi:MAG: radical SAM protein [Candidatus Cloacimonadaceae bacterium]
MKNLLEPDTKCLLIQPEISKYCSLNYKEVCQLVGAKYPTQPLGLLTVAALLPQNWKFMLVDANVEPLTDEHFRWADIVCSGGIISQQLEILALIERAHAFGKKIAIGGPEPSSQPQLYQDADYLIIGEGENTIHFFLQDLSRGVEKGIYKSEEKPDLSVSVIPRYDLIKMNDYLMMGIQFSRGCPFNCEFCDIIEIFGRQTRTKTTEQLINELQYLYDLGYRGRVFFVDDNFFGNRKMAKKLVAAIAEWMQKRNYPFYFAVETSMNLADDDELLNLAREAGFRYLSIGIETPENNILDSIEKRQNLNRSIPETIKKFYSYGMAVDTSLILGFDGETSGSANDIINCLQDSGICMAMIGTLYALPNTRLTKRLISEGRLWNDEVIQKDKVTDIDQMTSGLNFETSRPRKEILEDYVKILDAIYNPVNYYKRLINTGLNLKRSGRYHPGFEIKVKMLKAFLQVSRKAGFDKNTAGLYWKTVATVLFRNPGALEVVIGFAAMYFHLNKHAQFIIKQTRQKLSELESGPIIKPTAT